MKVRKVLHCPKNVAGNAGGLARAERAIGLDSIAVTVKPSFYSFRSDRTLLLEGSGPMRELRARLALYAIALSRYDCVHFNFGETMFPPPRMPKRGANQLALVLIAIFNALAIAVETVGLAVLRATGKRLVVTYQGNDARQGAFSRKNFAISIASEVGNDYYSTYGDLLKRVRIWTVGSFCHHIFALNPDLLRVLPPKARFLPYAQIDPTVYTDSDHGRGENRIVLHAPTNAAVKGTRYVESAIRALKSEGLDFTYDVVSGLPHSQALEHYRKAHIVVDQLLAGWYGGFAVEAMALGKPVIAYIRHSDLALIPARMRRQLPVVTADPESITGVLRRLFHMPDRILARLSAQARGYVLLWHDPRRIALYLSNCYRTSGPLPDFTPHLSPRSGSLASPQRLESESV